MPRKAKSIPGPTIEQEIHALNVLRADLSARDEKRRQSTPGIDPDGNLVNRNNGLLAFVRYFWDVLEPETPLVEGWAMDAICQHLEAVTLGKITRLLINVPPGFSKTLLTQVFWPAWEWSALNMPHLRYVLFSYSANITEERNVKFRSLIQSKKFQDMWGDRFKLEKIGEGRVTNDKTGSKFASSTTGISTSERGDRVIFDDPHSVRQAESDVVRQDTVRFFRESMTTRVNDVTRSAMVIIMQRVHQGDVSGFVLENAHDYCHLMIPMRFEAGREPNNHLGWKDPRTEDGELAWPERFPLDAVDRDEAMLGSFATAGQFQQRPAPRSGGIIEYNCWQQYNAESAAARFGMRYPMFPPMSFTVLSVDTAQTEKKQNDPSAAVLLGICQDAVNNRNQVMLMHAWTKRLEFFDLCNHVEDMCKRFRVHKVLIENKANGLPLAQELRRRGAVFSDKIAHGKKEFRERADFGIHECKPEGDKLSRLYAVQNLFEAGVIWAPCDDNDNFKYWAEQVMKQCAEAPKSEHDDLMDCMTQGLLFLRKCGLALMPDDFQFADEDAMKYKRPEQAMYPGFS
jgi:predicted phage terminase large subunit-like protein